MSTAATPEKKPSRNEELKTAIPTLAGNIAATLADTFPALLLAHARERGDRPALREKDLGIWQTYTWSQVARDVERMALGLATLGVAPGQHVAVVERHHRLGGLPGADFCRMSGR